MPERPFLEPLTAEEWKAISQPTREKLTDNQKKVLTYVTRLEQMMFAYEAWRTGKTN